MNKIPKILFSMLYLYFQLFIYCNLNYFKKNNNNIDLNMAL